MRGGAAAAEHRVRRIGGLENIPHVGKAPKLPLRGFAGVLSIDYPFRRPAPSPTNHAALRMLLPEVERHARDDDVRPEEQRALDEQRALVVQQVLPPRAARTPAASPSRSRRAARARPPRCIRAAAPSASGTATRSTTSSTPAPRAPIRAASARWRRVDVHVHRAHIVGQRPRVAQRLHDGALQAADRARGRCCAGRRRLSSRAASAAPRRARSAAASP